MAEANWYDDPSDPTRVRWWDGAAWTDHVAARPAPQPQPEVIRSTTELAPGIEAQVETVVGTDEEIIARAKATHPTLASSCIQQHNAWRAVVRVDKYLQPWEDAYFAGGRLFRQHLVNILGDGDILTKGDRACTAMFPVLYYADVVAPVPDGSKAKLPGSSLPATMAVLGTDLVFLVQIPDKGWMDMTIPVDRITGGRWIKAGGMSVVPKFPGLQLDIWDDGEQATTLLTFSQFLNDRQLDPIKAALAPICNR